MSGLDDARKSRERDFHDARFGAEVRQATAKYYSVDAGKAHYAEQVLERGAGRRVLEYGCGVGSYAFKLAEAGAEVTAIDISSVAIDKARARADELGLSIDFREMDAEHLDFANDRFDLVCGSGILHHLDLERAYVEVSRVLSSGGVGLFAEPLGHNPVINLYRRMTPRLRTPDEHPLVMADFELARRFFGRLEVTSFNLLALAGVLTRRLPGGRRLVGRLHRIDRWLLARSALARRWAWVAVIELSDPRDDSTG